MHHPRHKLGPGARTCESAACPTVADGRNGHDELTLQRSLHGVDYVWVNTNGFALGEQAEMYWGIRMFELSLRAGAKHFVYSGMDSAYKLSGYDPKCCSGHYEGRGKVSGKKDVDRTIVPLLILNVEWILSQPTSPMAWTIINPAAYNEMFYELFAPRPDASGTYMFTFPMGDGAMPTIYLYALGVSKSDRVQWTSLRCRHFARDRQGYG
jgi:hypothetical protein